MLLLVLMPGLVTAGDLDDFVDHQATLTDTPDTADSFTSWQTLTVPDGLAGFRRLFVNGGLNGDSSNSTSIGVAGGALTFGFGHEPGLSDQAAIVSWSDRDSSVIWSGSLDLSGFDALVMDMGLVTQPVNVVLSLREKTSAVTQISHQVIGEFGLYVFNLTEFDMINLGEVDIINLRITPAQSASADGLANFNAVYFFEDEIIFNHDFE